MAHEPAQMGAHLDTRRGLAGAQHDRDGTRALGVVDMDRQEAALVIMGVEERELLTAAYDIAGVVDIENDRRGLPFIGGHPLIDERPREPDRILQRRRVLQPRQRRLRTQVRARVWQRPQASLKAGSARKASRSSASSYPQAIARMRPRTMSASVCVMRSGSRRSGKHRANLSAIPNRRCRHREQHDAAIRSRSPAIKSGCDRFAANCWK